jgi:hypothetical protein
MVRDSVCTDPCESQKTEISNSANSQTPRIDSEKKPKRVVRALTPTGVDALNTAERPTRVKARKRAVVYNFTLLQHRGSQYIPDVTPA